MTTVNADDRVISAVLFDLDGTVLDSAADFAATLSALCEENGWQQPSTEALHQTVSSGARAMLTLASGVSDSAPEFDRLLAIFLDRYSEQIRNPVSRLYPGMKALLEMLDERRIPWGIVTNKPLRFSAPLLRSLGIQHNCSVLVCPDHVQTSKPSPEPLLLAAEQLQLPAENCIYVGDHQRDIQAGHAANMATIAAAYGYLPAPDDNQSLGVHDWLADYVVNDVAALHALLTRLLAR